MKRNGILMATTTLAALGIGAGWLTAQDEKKQSKEKAPPAGLEEMMKQAAKFTQPGEQHKLLERFLGKWKTRSRVILPGQESPAEEGTAEGTWIMEGRWLKFSTKGSFFGMPSEGFSIIGYDNFKMSYVVTSVSSMDTAMVRSEGDLTPDGKSLILYGTLDEYLTGENDKMVKTAWRFHSEDKMTMEIHDLPIGEENTKVVEVEFTRVK